jgi:hypothetical protein
MEHKSLSGQVAFGLNCCQQTNALIEEDFRAKLRSGNDKCRSRQLASLAPIGTFALRKNLGIRRHF